VRDTGEAGHVANTRGATGCRRLGHAALRSAYAIHHHTSMPAAA
jgi:hypothetical protein